VNNELIQDSVNSDVTTYAPAPAATPTPAPDLTPTHDPEELAARRAVAIDRATAAAKTQIADVEAFIQEHPQTPQLLDYVDRLSALSAAVKSSDPDAIERKSTELSATLSHDKDYQRRLVDLAETQRKKTAQYLIDAVRLGEAQRAFIMDFIAKNPLDGATPSLAALVKQVTPLLQKNDLTSLQATIDKIALTIRESNLLDAFLAAQKGTLKASLNTADAQSTSTAGATSPPAPASISVQLLTTDKNRFLIEGDLDDIEILYNGPIFTPHRAKPPRRIRLRGQ
jgi:hypothetical protein